MAVTFTKAHVKRMTELLSGDFDTAEEAAQAALDLACDIYEERSKYAVIAQVKANNADEERESRTIVLGPFSSEAPARKAGESVAIGTPTHEESRWFLCRWWTDSPNAWYVDRKAERVSGHLVGGKTPAERLLDALNGAKVLDVV